MLSFVSNDGKIIYYKVVDNYSEKIKIINGVEKIGRYIYFYNEKEDFIKWKRIYGEFDEMQNISPLVAKASYEKDD